nr:MAG TPA: hypothetical protein [Caudoviricetes sp.]
MKSTSYYLDSRRFRAAFFSSCSRRFKSVQTKFSLKSKYSKKI